VRDGGNPWGMTWEGAGDDATGRRMTSLGAGEGGDITRCREGIKSQKMTPLDAEERKMMLWEMTSFGAGSMGSVGWSLPPLCRHCRRRAGVAFAVPLPSLHTIFSLHLVYHSSLLSSSCCILLSINVLCFNMFYSLRF